MHMDSFCSEITSAKIIFKVKLSLKAKILISLESSNLMPEIWIFHLRIEIPQK